MESCGKVFFVKRPGESQAAQIRTRQKWFNGGCFHQMPIAAFPATAKEKQSFKDEKSRAPKLHSQYTYPITKLLEIKDTVTFFDRIDTSHP